MDLNITVLSGRLAAVPELRTFTSGTTLMRFLVTVRTEEPRRRVDVIPVVLWNPEESLLEEQLERGTTIWIAGAVQRRFWTADDGRHSRVEIVAHAVVSHGDADETEPDEHAEAS